MKGAIAALARRIEESGARTLGQYLFLLRGVDDGGAPVSVRRRKPVRARLRGKEYDLYADRGMYEAEFDALWQAQLEFNPALTETARAELRDIMFFQRRLRPVDPGKCALDPSDQRAPEALPLAQKFRIWQELANLRIVKLDRTSEPLTMRQRAVVAAELERPKRKSGELSFEQMRRLLGLDSSNAFNLESEKRTGLKADQTGLRLADKTRFGPAWWELSEERQNAIVERLLAEEDEERLVALAQQDWGLSEDAARAVARTALPDGYGRVGRRAMAKLVPIMRDQGLVYADAAKEAGYHHSDRRPGELSDELPYYGAALARHVAWGSNDPDDPEEARFGKIGNPTVHIGLNQLRKVVNALIARYGRPEQIVVELARELKLGKASKDAIRKRQAEEQKRNDKWRVELAAMGLRDTGENLLRLRLWEELNPKEPHNRRCVYTGEPISIARLFGPEVEIEHILPFRRTLDNSPANKTVSLRRANRFKGNGTPWEAFGQNPPGYSWDEILLRSADLPKNKRWRFAADAMERFENEEKDFLDRQLTDTAYLARVTREYLTHVCKDVSVIPGRLTSLLRGRWGLNKLLSDHNLKNRVDHRHHAIDAFVAGVTDRAMLQKIASAADQDRDRLIEDMPDPWEGFRDQLGATLARVVVSHKPDHGVQGRLHEETAYGIVPDPDKEGGATLVARKALASLTPAEIERVRDPKLRAALIAEVLPHKGDKKTYVAALTEFGARHEIRRVRVLKTEGSFIRVNGPGLAPYKALIAGDNHHVDIRELPDGQWVGETVTVFDANRTGNGSRPAPTGAKLIMRLHKNDLLLIEHKGVEQIMRVVSIWEKLLQLAADREGGNLQQRHKDADDPFQWYWPSFTSLKQRRARKVTVDVLGRVSDPGPPR
jgi:CRISPR-associated endonuclease Csn1